MPTNYFAGAPNAFAGGMQYTAAVRDQRRRENALNRLIERFGPEAAAPEEMIALEGAERARDLHPLNVRQQELGVADAERVDAARRSAVETYGATAGDPQVQSRDIEIRRRVGLGAARFLQNAQRRGTDMGAAYDRMAPILVKLGLPEEEILPIREMITQDPESVNDLVAMLTGSESGMRATGAPVPVYDEQGRLRLLQHMSDGTSRIIEGVTPASAAQAEERLGQGRARLGLQGREISRKEAQDAGFDAPPGYQLWWDEESGRIIADPIPGGGPEAERDIETGEAIGELSDAIQGAVATVLTPAAAVQTNGERVLGYMQESGWRQNVLSSNVRAAQAKVRGTQAWEISQMLETLKANIGFAQLSNMTRGLGAVSERELQQLESVLGRLDVARDPALLEADLQRVLEMHRDIVAKTETAIERRQEEIERARTRREQRYGPPIPPRPGAEPSPTEEEPLESLLERYQ